MIFGRVAGRLRRRWRRTLAAAAVASVLSGGGITAYSTNFDHLLGRVLADFLDARMDRCVEHPTGPTICAEESPETTSAPAEVQSSRVAEEKRK
jgi:hypothetical protein